MKQFSDIVEFENKHENETNEQFIQRLCDNKNRFGLSWDDVADIANSACNLDYTESWYRKRFKQRVINTIAQDMESEEKENDPERDRLQTLNDVLINIRNEKQRLIDERTQNNAILRRLSREDNLMQLAREAAEKIGSKILLDPVEHDTSVDFFTNENCAVLSLADWHYGAFERNYWNNYDIDIAKLRIQHLRDCTIGYCKRNNIGKLVVLNLGDLISGRIHSDLRITNQIDICDQTLQVAEILSEFLHCISKELPKTQIHYHSATDNHSRIEPNIKESLDTESMQRMITPFVKIRLAGDKNIYFHDNTYDDGIVSFEARGFLCMGVHGHQDKVNSVLANLTLMTDEKPYIIFTAHNHHLDADEQHRSMVIGSPSLMGTDANAKNNRLTSTPAQIITTIGAKGIDDIHYINLE